LSQLEISRVPPHLNPLPPGERKEEIKDEILTPLDTEGERARGGEGERGRKFEDGTLTASKNEASG
jgi:hypothetical protein